MFPADLAFFYLFSFLFIYFRSLICISTNLSSICCQCCVNMNMQCKLVPLSLYEQLNHLLVTLNTVACGVGDLTTLAGLGCLFMSAVCHHCHHLYCSAAAPAATINPFSSPAEFSHLISALKSILGVLCYHVC